jgi:hypothetical protein
MRKRYPIAILVILLVAVALSASLAIADAKATTTFVACGVCHSSAAQHPVHGSVPCATCHVDGITNPPSTAACASCHGGEAAVVSGHPNGGCTVSGCHAAPAPVATTITLKVAPTSIKLKKTVKASGAVTPIVELTGFKVALKAELKKGSKWVKAKTATATVGNLGTYSWTYKPAKKGTYRMTATVAASATHLASKSLVKAFKVK